MSNNLSIFCLRSRDIVRSACSSGAILELEASPLSLPFLFELEEFEE